MSTKKKQDWQLAIEEAADELGTRYKLALAIGVRPGRIYRIMKGDNVSAEIAKKIAEVSSIPLHRLRPDLWGPDD